MVEKALKGQVQCFGGYLLLLGFPPVLADNKTQQTPREHWQRPRKLETRRASGGGAPPLPQLVHPGGVSLPPRCALVFPPRDVCACAASPPTGA